MRVKFLTCTKCLCWKSPIISAEYTMADCEHVSSGENIKRESLDKDARTQRKRVVAPPPEHSPYKCLHRNVYRLPPIDRRLSPDWPRRREFSARMGHAQFDTQSVSTVSFIRTHNRRFTSLNRCRHRLRRVRPRHLWRIASIICARSIIEHSPNRTYIGARNNMRLQWQK
jgi:hypothetical protein